MKRNFVLTSLIISVLVILVAVSCKKKEEAQTSTPSPSWNSPEPAPGGNIPESILPESLSDSVTAYFTVYSGENPPAFDGQFVSHPHMLLHSSFANDTVTVFNDRYIAFFGNGESIDFYGKQWDNDYNDYYEEAYRRLHVIGTGENFSCYYLMEGYPNGMYAKQSTVFSGKWNESYGGLKDFQVAVILLETSGNPNLAPVGSFRVLGDGDGLAMDTTWMGSKRAAFNDVNMTSEDAFRMFRVK